MTDATTSSVTRRNSILRIFQIFTVLAAVNVLAQFITAGQLFPDGGPEQAHAAGAITLHILSGVTAIAALILWRRKEMTTGIAALTAAVFLFTFIQAAIGGRASLWIHVPGAMLLSVGIAWQLFAALRFRSISTPAAEA